MPYNTEQANPTQTKDRAILSWTVHLARQHPSRLAVAVAFVTLAACAGYFAIGPLAAVAVALVLSASLADFLFPVSYVLTRDGAECRMLFKSSQIRWENVRHCYVDDQGVKLSPLPRQSRLEAFRGVYLRFADNEEQVTEAVKSLRPRKCTE